MGKNNISPEQAGKQKSDCSNTVYYKKTLSSVYAVADLKNLVFTENDKKQLIKKSCKILLNINIFNNVWIILINPDTENIDFFEAAGDKGRKETVKKLLNEKIFPSCIKKTISSKKTVIIKDPAAECKNCPLSRYDNGKSRIVSAFEYKEKVFGIISAAVDKNFPANKEAVSIFNEFINDISYALDKIEKESLLEEYQWQLQRAQNVAAVGSWSFDLDNGKVYASEQAKKIYGIVSPENTIKNIQKIPLPEYRKVLDNSLANLIKQKKPYDVEFAIIRKTDNKLRYIHSLAEYDRKKNKVIGIIQDITEKKQTEKKLKEREDFFSAVIQSTADAFWITDINGKIKEVNKAYCRMSGYCKQDLIDLNIGKLDAEETPDKTEKRIIRIIKNGSEIFEAYHRRKDGSLFPLEVSATFMPEYGGNFLCFARDLTEKKKTEEALIESESKFRNMAENLSDFLFMTDIKGIITYASPSSLLFFGFKPSEMEGTPFRNYISEEYQQLAEKDFRNTIKSKGKTSNLLLKFIKKDKSFFWGEMSGSMLENNGKVTGALGVLRDTTEKKEYEEKLIYSEERYKLLSDVTTEGILIHLNKVAKDANTRLCEMIGYKKEELINRDLLFLVHSDYREKVLENLKKEICPPYTVKLQKKDGSYFYSEIEAKNIKTLNGTVRATAFRDVTEQKKAEEKLKASEKNFRLLIENLPDEVFIHDLDGNIKFTNKIASINTGYSMDELTSLSIYDLDPEAETREDKVIFWKSLDYSKTQLISAKHLRKDGSIYPVEVLISIMHIYDEDLIIAVSRDMTERVEKEKEKSMLQEQLSQAQKLESIGRLAGGVAHDFNNMLSIIMGNADLAARYLEKSDPVYEKIEKINQAAERSADLTKQLLAFARKQTVKPEILDINATIESILKMGRRLIGEDINLKWTPSITGKKVCIDPSQIDQIVINLVINARDAIGNKRGNILIETHNITINEEYCKNHPTFTVGEYIRIDISDDGCGINKEDSKYIFEPFFTTKSKDKGTGLGLATVYGIIKQNNGFINVYSEPGTGTTFKIYFPVSRNESLLKENIKTDKERRTGNETIFIVEDEKDIHDMVTEALTAFGYNVISAFSPVEALNKAKDFKGSIDLVLTDVIMPEMNGRELAQKILSLYPDVKLLFMSGYTADIIANQGILQNEVSFIQKPFSISDLNTKIREILDKN